jgi:altronate dehydratase large subunit
LGQHSSYAAALVVGLGCEGTEAYMVAEAIAKSGKPVEAVKINQEGGDLKTIEKGSRILVKLLQHASLAERAKMTPADLIVGQECGGSDATSGLASNPITGVAADLLIEAGGTYMHSEVEELLGCGEALAARAVNPSRWPGRSKRLSKRPSGVALRAGGSPGAMATSWRAHEHRREIGGLPDQIGHQAPAGHPHANTNCPKTKGYYIQIGEPGSGTFHGDPEGVNQFAACGAHLCLFTTGCGSTTGGLIPVIKIIANPKRMQLIEDNADFDATPVILGEKTIREMGEELYAEILAVAAGKRTKSEIYRHYEA